MVKKNLLVDPLTYRVSKHFTLADFLGCHSVYSKGYANPFVFGGQADIKIDNLKALCENALEPLLNQFGPMTIGYGYISPELSRKIVHYQDPDKPSHHRFDLGAAADICVHKWVQKVYPSILDLYAPESVIGSPIGLAHGIDYLNIPYSRLITYSESSYICIAVSARELAAKAPRKAFYENRYTGKSKIRPDYRQYASPQAKIRALKLLQEEGLPFSWEGAGYPTYHGGGYCQYHHRRVSKYTMVSDWLFDLKSITIGEKNIPSLNDERVLDAFAAAGIVYDNLIKDWGVPRISIVEGYVSPLNSNSKKSNDWREPTIQFVLLPPEQKTELTRIEQADYRDGVTYTMRDQFIVVRVNVKVVLASSQWEV